MDDILEGLRRAHSASPENGALLGVLLKALLDANHLDEAIQRLEGVDSTGLDAPGRRVAAEVCLLNAQPERALDWVLKDDTPTALLLRARAHAELGHVEEGRRAYRSAVRQSSALEDPELEARLSAPPSERESPQPLRLKVIDGGSTEEVRELFAPEQKRVCFEDVGGLDGVKKQIRKRIILPFAKPTLFQRFKRKVGGGILMYGPPGCGKTLLARATAGEAEARFFAIAISDVLDMWFGESEQKLHRAFEEARDQAPAVLFFDEIEAIGGKRQYGRDSTSAKLVSQFLAEMDGFAQNNQGVLVLGATNVPWSVDPAFRRPGRFDRVQFVPPPDREARQAILRLHLADRPVADSVDPAVWAKKTGGFSGADLANLVDTAADAAIAASIEAEADVPLSPEHLAESLSEVRPTTAEWLTTARNHARYANEGGQYDEVLEFLRKHGK
ncbi:MAG: ATP-binding protein [Myxococcota bacterium]